MATQTRFMFYKSILKPKLELLKMIIPTFQKIKGDVYTPLTYANPMCNISQSDSLLYIESRLAYEFYRQSFYGFGA